MMRSSSRLHPLQSIFHPDWTPADDSQLLALRDQGVSLERIAIALMRHPKAVEQRWHRLRVVPGVRGRLKEIGATAREYPIDRSADLQPATGEAAP